MTSSAAATMTVVAAAAAATCIDLVRVPGLFVVLSVFSVVQSNPDEGKQTSV